MRTIALLALVTSCITLGACGRDKDRDVKVSLGGDSVTALPPLGDGDVAITSTDGSFVMAVIGDSVRMQLSDSLRTAVSRDVASKGKEGGIGGMIASSLSGIVGKAMGFSVRIPVENVENLRYENGHITFGSKGGQVNVSSGSGGKGSGASTYSEADAKRFIDAVHARQREKGMAN